MQQAKAFHSFSDACERFVSSIAKNRSLSNDEAQVIAFYCKEIREKIEPSLHKHSRDIPNGASEVVRTAHT
jgi:hypothetical protein